MDDNELIEIGKPYGIYNTNGKLSKYTVDVFHKGLKERKLISDKDSYTLQQKVKMQIEKWNYKWNIIQSRQQLENEAADKTKEAQETLIQIKNILKTSLKNQMKIVWESLKIHGIFNEPKPEEPVKKPYPNFYLSPKPDPNSEEFIPSFGFFEKINKAKKEKKIQEYELKYKEALESWEKKQNEIEQIKAKFDNEYKVDLAKWNKEIKVWKEKEKDFNDKKEKNNEKIDKFKETFLNNDKEAIEEYFSLVLNNSEYPILFKKNIIIQYNPDNKILVVEYDLPTVKDLPKISEVKYVISSKKLKEINLSETQLEKMYDDVIYQITLRSLYELFYSDTQNMLEAISFNGWVNDINKATGKKVYKCILSIQAKKEEFMEINFKNVEPKSCFKKLKGVASSKLNTLTPIQPIMQIDRNDKRIIEGYEVVDKLNAETNIAAMDWEDFEHLIRELFEKEFSVNGGEVKVTQASKDGGVDAIAYDPDPIRGGKIVIQAKRYTNTVGVSAIRDLYGTVVNEGATKGILVTTASYGADSYEFAKNKPIILLNGSNLLHLLEKHGYHATIDIKEAKKIISENS